MYLYVCGGVVFCFVVVGGGLFFFLANMLVLCRKPLKPIEIHVGLWKGHLAVDSVVNPELGSHVNKNSWV